MSTKKISTLTKLLEEEQLYKMAQQIGNKEGEISQEEADKIAQEAYEKIFDEELKKIVGQ